MLDEDIVISDWDKSSLREEKMKILSGLFDRKEKQVKLRRECQQKHAHKQVLYDTNDIFLDSFFIDNLDENAPIIEKLIKIIERINEPFIDANENLMQWSEKQFEKVMEKVVT